jgi:hypothetical protein
MLIFTRISNSTKKHLCDARNMQYNFFGWGHSMDQSNEILFLKGECRKSKFALASSIDDVTYSVTCPGGLIQLCAI